MQFETALGVFPLLPIFVPIRYIGLPIFQRYHLMGDGLNYPTDFNRFIHTKADNDTANDTDTD